MALTAWQRFELKKFVKNLEKHRGRHTELVSVYIPSGYDLNKIIQHVSQEQSTASNIKDSTTRKNVTDSLERMIQHLRLFKRTPEHGLAVFSGNTAERAGQQDINVFSIEPPVPLKLRIYRCDKEFVLEPLREMLETKEVFALIVMDRREGNIAMLKGKTIIPVVKSTSNVPGKQRAGGQSAPRFERLREGAAKEFYKRLGDHVKKEFLGKKELKGIIVGGPGPTKNSFVDGNFLPTEIKKKILAVKDTTYTGAFGLQELLDKSKDVLSKEEVSEEKRIVQNFLELLSKKPNMVAYGEEEVRKSLELGVVDTLLISESLEEKKIEEFENIAKKFSTKIEIISTETREGVQLRDLGKIAAILRYELK